MYVPSPLSLSHTHTYTHTQAIRRSVRYDEYGNVPMGSEVEVAKKSYVDLGAVTRKLVLGFFGAIDQTLEALNIFPILRPPKAFMSRSTKVVGLQSQLRLLTLSNDAITEREEKRRELQSEIIAEGKHTHTHTHTHIHTYTHTHPYTLSVSNTHTVSKTHTHTHKQQPRQACPWLQR
jgi:ABC-type nickel/cobalt efflux system permease component RcnA